MKTAICICTCERPALLGTLLSSLRDIDLTSLDEVEIIVVDNAPESAKSACLEASNLPVPIHYKPEPARGRSFARNSAIDQALTRGTDFVAFLDDDDIPEPDWLRHLVKRQNETSADIVYGAWRQGPVDTAPEWAQKTLSVFKEPDFNELNSLGIPRRIGTGNVLISSDFLRNFDRPVFDPTLPTGEDTDFRIRAARAGASLVFSGDSVIHRGHSDRQTNLKTLRRAFQHGCSRATRVCKYKSRLVIWRSCAVAVVKFVLRLIFAPLYVLIPHAFMRNVWSIVRGAGLINTYATLGFRTMAGRSVTKR